MANGLIDSATSPLTGGEKSMSSFSKTALSTDMGAKPRFENDQFTQEQQLRYLSFIEASLCSSSHSMMGFHI